MTWTGDRLIGGGPMIQYEGVFAPRRNYGQFTWAGDFIAGGGKQDKWAAYFHGTGGIGFIGSEGEFGFGVRLMVGVGAFGMVSERVSLGVLIDGGLWSNAVVFGLDAKATLGFHFL